MQWKKLNEAHFLFKNVTPLLGTYFLPMKILAYVCNYNQSTTECGTGSLRVHFACIVMMTALVLSFAVILVAWITPPTL